MTPPTLALLAALAPAGGHGRCCCRHQGQGAGRGGDGGGVAAGHVMPAVGEDWSRAVVHS